MAATRTAVAAAPAADRIARVAERLLRVAGDGRTGLLLLAATGLANVAAAFAGQGLLDGVPYAVLLALLALSAVAAAAVRVPATWREWRRPGPVQHGRGTATAALPELEASVVVATLRSDGWRVRVEEHRDRWSIHAVRHGWARFAGTATHLSLIVIVLGAAGGHAFGSETTASLLTGDQMLLDAPRPGFNDAVRLDRLDAAFGPDGRPTRLDTHVTFLRDGGVERQAVIRVNEPASFDGYLVHAWTYGPAVRLRVSGLGGTTLLDAPVPLDESTAAGAPAGAAELPTAGLTLGLVLADGSTGELGVSALGPSGLVDTARLRPGEEARLGDVRVALDGFDAWVTIVSRRDPGLPLLIVGGAGLAVGLAVGLWLPRRRLSIRRHGEGLQLAMRAERFDRIEAPLAQLAARLRRRT